MNAAASLPRGFAMPDTMTKAQLDRIHSDVKWQIAKRTGVAAVKALTIGTESLDDTISAIADAYHLSLEDRERLRPSKSIDVTDGIGNAVDGAKKLAGFGVAAFDQGKIASIAKLALKNGRVVNTAKAFATTGLKGAGKVARTGAVASKATPWVAVAAGLYAAGSAGWFAHKAYAFNNRCHELLLGRISETQLPITQDIQPILASKPS